MLRIPIPALCATLSISVAACTLDRREPQDQVVTSADAASLREPLPEQLVAFRIPQESEVRDTMTLASIRRGRALLRDTRDSLPRHVGNKLQCTSCHHADGTIPLAMPWVGVYARFPQYRSRAGSVQVMADRINDCFKRSMNGRPLVPESQDMRDMIAYFAFLSIGYPVGAAVDGQGLPQITPREGDSTRGQQTYMNKCAACHGLSGEGTPAAPPVWGKDSYNIGAGMSRLRTAAAFIKGWMPQTAPGTLTDEEAFDVAKFINSQPRPDFAGKAQDWPYGDPPPDAAYPTTGARRRD